MNHHLFRPGVSHTHHISTAVIAGHGVVGRTAARSRSRRRQRSEDKNVPKFLLQSHADIRRKFLELENLQNERLFEITNGNAADSRWHIDDSPEALARDRYSNIHAWERNRIHLNVPPEHSDYINASPITLTSRKDGSVKRYIATQGPKEDQFNHLWRMVWQETGPVAVIVMLTKTFELGRDKCFQYFPESDPEPWHVGDGEFGDGFTATVTLLEKTKHRRSSCTVRKLLLTVNGQQKLVWHLLFKGWPDYNVPEGDDKTALLELIKLANEKNVGPNNPLIVHCSAGVGRSGTFITLDHFLREIDAGTISVDERQDLVFDTVNQLREQRMYMVQSNIQFEFIYTVLRERFGRRGKSASPPSTHSAPVISEEEPEDDAETNIRAETASL